jgi:hypothetical protein
MITIAEKSGQAHDRQNPAPGSILDERVVQIPRADFYGGKKLASNRFSN